MFLSEVDKPGRFLIYVKAVTVSLGLSSGHGIKADKLEFARKINLL